MTSLPHVNAKQGHKSLSTHKLPSGTTANARPSMPLCSAIKKCITAECSITRKATNESIQMGLERTPPKYIQTYLKNRACKKKGIF